MRTRSQGLRCAHICVNGYGSVLSEHRAIKMIEDTDTSFKLTGTKNFVSTSFLRSVCRRLGELQHLEMIDMSMLKLKGSNIEVICELLRTNTSITKVSFGVLLEDSSLTEHLANNSFPHLREITLQFRYSGYVAAHALLCALRSNTHIRKLKIKGLATAATFLTLKGLFDDNTSITELLFGHNEYKLLCSASFLANIMSKVHNNRMKHSTLYEGLLPLLDDE